VTSAQFLWALSRTAGLTSLAALALCLVSGLALRTAVLDWLGSNRELRALHEFSAVLWIPLGALHVLGLLLDNTARIRALDLVLPFHAVYAPLAIGLGSLSLELVALVAVSGWLRRRLPQGAFIWVHRLGYLAFAAAFLHAVLAGTDTADPAVSALTWAAAGMIAVLAVARLIFGRLPE